jgi:bifunctional DNA-binding transcriptional regulator/antitoxin component of YhaV-PrlF toxin-antitoxin module
MPIPEELMAKLGWNENDVLQWVIEDDCINLVKADGNV